MQAVANNPKFAKKVGVPQSVGKEFTMKKYQSGGMMSSPRPKMRPKGMEGGMAPRRSIRPRMRPEDLMEGENTTAPRRSIRPKARPKGIEDMMSPDTAVGRGNRASMREAMDMPPEGMKSGGKVRGYGKARGGKTCKMY